MKLTAIQTTIMIKEEKKIRHSIARFEGALHSNVEIERVTELENGKREVFAKIKGYKYGYIFSNERIMKAWRIIA